MDTTPPYPRNIHLVLPDRLVYLLRIMTLAIIYFVAARLGLLVPFDGEIATLVWPAGGISLAVLLLFGANLWPGVTLGAILIGLSNQHSIPLLLGVSIARTIEPLLAVYLIRKYGSFDSSLENLRDVFTLFLAGGLLAPAVSATLSGITFMTSPEGNAIMGTTIWWHWFVGHSISILLVTPVLLTWHANPRLQWQKERLTEILVLLAVMIVVSTLIFVRVIDSIGNFPLGHVIFPFLLWAALRYSPREVSTYSLIAVAIAIWGTVHGTGPFSRPDININLLLLLSFVISITLTALIIAVLLTERRRSREALQRSKDELAIRIDERTLELAQANEQLIQEINERKYAQEELAQARDRAVDALRLKAQILANVSHDARTPLSVIMLYAELLKRGRHGSVTDKQKRSLETILINANDLLGFINNLLDEAQIENSKVEAALEDIDLRIWLDDAVQTFQPMAARKNLALRVQVGEHMPQTVCTDPEKLKQIFNNLVSNAIKFTVRGQVLIQVLKMNQHFWVLRVSDTGPGIPEAAQTRIFDAFWQLDGSMTREVNRGVGLGLSIVRELTNLLGGEITLYSRMGRGSAFTVKLPLEYLQKAHLLGE